MADRDEALRAHARLSLRSYWTLGADTVHALPIPHSSVDNTLPPPLTEVAVPVWAAEAGVKGALLVPEWSLVPGEGAPWQRVDWWLAAGWYLHGVAERAWEAKHGPIHSNRFRLRGWDDRMWRHAWVNRIAMFLRAWGAHSLHRAPRELGPLPHAEIRLTHDVDAIGKTGAIRVKQGIFKAVNASRAVLRGEPGRAIGSIAKALAFAFSADDYHRFEEILALEEQAGVRSDFFFFAGWNGKLRHPRAALFDPGYRCDAPALSEIYRRLRAGGWQIGVHPSFDHWRNAGALREERLRLAAASRGPVTALRQHWLRFSWAETWQAQHEAGFTLDMTLGFNDAPAFRNAAALPFAPLNADTLSPIGINALPMLLMDSHLYDYGDIPADQLADGMRGWLRELKAVGGTASVIWHQQAFGRDYGWSDGYRLLLDLWNEAP